jgi:transcriptional regulator with PAS, ATPase and Fis domain
MEIASAADVPNGYQPLVNSASMRRIKAMVTRVAATDVTVLISGESGVGKEVVARALHECSHRQDQPFVKVNCAALPVELLESELFGYERGVFTGAHQQKRGKFEQAHRGTIFMDEISELPLSVQAKLLQVLQDHEFARLGSEHDIRVDVRVIAATNRDLSRYVAQGGFREDLFHRLNVVNIRVPALRERPEEIPFLVEHFLALYRRKHRGGPREVTPAALERLRRYSWPGNVRELENVIQRIVVLGTEAVVAGLDETNGYTSVPELVRTASPEAAAGLSDDSLGLKELARRAAQAAEREALKRTLARAHWRRVAAARRLQISYKTLWEKIKHYRLDFAWRLVVARERGHPGLCNDAVRIPECRPPLSGNRFPPRPPSNRRESEAWHRTWRHTAPHMSVRGRSPYAGRRRS